MSQLKDLSEVEFMLDENIKNMITKDKDLQNILKFNKPTLYVCYKTITNDYISKALGLLDLSKFFKPILRNSSNNSSNNNIESFLNIIELLLNKKRDDVSGDVRKRMTSVIRALENGEISKSLFKIVTEFCGKLKNSSSRANTKNNTTREEQHMEAAYVPPIQSDLLFCGNSYHSFGQMVFASYLNNKISLRDLIYKFVSILIFGISYIAYSLMFNLFLSDREVTKLTTYIQYNTEIIGKKNIIEDIKCWKKISFSNAFQFISPIIVTMICLIKYAMPDSLLENISETLNIDSSIVSLVPDELFCETCLGDAAFTYILSNFILCINNLIDESELFESSLKLIENGIILVNVLDNYGIY